MANAESDWFSVHGVHHPGRPVCGAAKPGSFQLRAPVMHMIRAAQRFYRSTEAEAISRGISLPDEQSDDLNCILFRLVVIRMQQAGVSSIENKPSHMLVRNTRPMQLPTFRINLIDPLKAITLALNVSYLDFMPNRVVLPLALLSVMSWYSQLRIRQSHFVYQLNACNF